MPLQVAQTAGGGVCVSVLDWDGGTQKLSVYQAPNIFVAGPDSRCLKPLVSCTTIVRESVPAAVPPFVYTLWQTCVSCYVMGEMAKYKCFVFLSQSVSTCKSLPLSSMMGSKWPGKWDLSNCTAPHAV